MLEVIHIDELLRDMWESYAMLPTRMIVSEHGMRVLMRLKFPPLPHARTSNMRHLRKLKYRRHP